MDKFLQPKKIEGEYFYFGKKCKQKPLFCIGLKSVIANILLIFVIFWFGDRLGDFQLLGFYENVFILIVCILYAYAIISEFLDYRSY